MPDPIYVRLVSTPALAAPGRAVYPSALYTVDEHGLPCWSEWRPMGDGVYAVRRPSPGPFSLDVLWEIPRFGQVMVRADGNGEGYRPGQSGVLEFREEAARTKVRWLYQRLEALATSGIDLGREARDRIAFVRSRADRICGPDSDTQPRLDPHALDAVLAAAFWAGEAAVLAQAGAALAARPHQERRELLFGASFNTALTNLSDGYLTAYPGLFNFATLPFYRGHLQPTPEAVDWRPLDASLRWLSAHDISAKGHPLFWPIKPAGLPKWMQKLGYGTLRDVVYQQVVDTVSRFKDRIKIWDVINEAHDPVTLNAGHLALTPEQAVELTALVCRAVREADPEAVRIVNCNKLEGYYRADDEHVPSLHALEYLDLLEDAGVDYEVLGLQMYQGATEHWISDMSVQSAMLDRFSAYGKPIHITEVQVPSSMEGHSNYIRLHPDEGGWWHRPWDREVQADWVEQFYTIALSKPSVQAVTWWSLSDSRTFWPSGGLLDAEDRPKPAYHRLKCLLDRVRSQDMEVG